MSVDDDPPRDGRDNDDDPSKRLDPHNTISLCAGESLISRPLPRALVYMLDRERKAEIVRLWECEAWSTGGPDDVISLPGNRWAIGVWNERETDGYCAHPVGGFPLVEVSKEHVIAHCKRCGRAYPMPILRELAAAGLGGTPRADDRTGGEDASGSKDLLSGDPAARAVAAAYALRKAGKPVSVRAACKAAKVDRKNLAANHPETIELIEKLGEPDRTPPRKASDRRTGDLDAWDDPE